jgi:hypothetical protein
VLDYFHHLVDFASVVLVNGAGKNCKRLGNSTEIFILVATAFVEENNLVLLINAVSSSQNK